MSLRLQSHLVGRVAAVWNRGFSFNCEAGDRKQDQPQEHSYLPAQRPTENSAPKVLSEAETQEAMGPTQAGRRGSGGPR